MSKRLLILWLCMYCFACEKGEMVKPYAYLSVKFIEDEDYVLMERIECSWLPDKKQASLNAYGFRNEHFSIYLPDLTQTGRYPNLAIKNIFYSDGSDFNPIKVDSGVLEITEMDSTRIGGTFKVILEDEYNGIEHRMIVGNFVIYGR